MRYLLIIIFAYLMVISENIRAEENDVEVILISSIIYKDGSYEMGEWKFYNGSPDIFKGGGYHILMKDINGKVISDTSFDLSFKVHVSPLGTMETNATYISNAFSYQTGTSYIELMSPNGLIFRVNPNIKILRDTINAIPNGCFTNSPNKNRIKLISSIDKIEEFIKNKDKLSALSVIEAEIVSTINDNLSEDKECQKTISKFGIKMPHMISKIIPEHMISSIIPEYMISRIMFDTTLNKEKCYKMLPKLSDECRISIKTLVIETVERVSLHIDNMVLPEK